MIFYARCIVCNLIFLFYKNNEGVLLIRFSRREILLKREPSGTELSMWT